MSLLTARFRSLAFELEADAALLSWVEQFFPSVPLCPGPDVSLWRILARRGETAFDGAPPGTAQGFTFDGRFSENQVTRDGRGRLWIADEAEPIVYRLDNEQREVSIISSAGDSPTRVALMRTARELVTTACLRDGLLPVHGAAFVGEDGKAVMVCGRKRAGKTSLLVHALRSGATYLANDRLMLEPAAPFPAHGVPTVVSVRPGMRKLFADLQWAPPPSPGAPLWMTPAKLAEITGAPTLVRAPLGTLLFPQVDLSKQGLLLQRLEPEACAHALGESLLRPSDPIRSSEVFTLGSGRQLLQPGWLESALRKVAGEIPAFTCVLGEGAFATPLPPGFI